MSVPRLVRGGAIWVGCVASAGAMAAVAGLWIAIGGLFDVRASTPHLAPVAWITHATMVHAERRLARDVRAPSRFSPDQVQSGARLYADRCAACHGGPGVARARWASGLTPSPPYLLDAARHWTPAELYVIAHDGVKMTAMPAWGETEPPARVWEVVGFLETLPGLSAADYSRLTAPEPRADLLQQSAAEQAPR